MEAEQVLKGKILITDDEEVILNVYGQILTENGYEVETAVNGEEAIQKALDFSPDAILLDVMMPVLDGLSACKVLKKDDKTKDIPIIIVSALSKSDDILNGLKAGANEYLSKPFRAEELIVRVQSMVELKKTHDNLKRVNSNLEEKVRRKTEQLMEAARFELIGKMVSGIGHDLNNLLTGVVGYCQLTGKANSLELAKKYNEKLGMSLNLSQNFVKNLLNFSKTQKPSLTCFDPMGSIDTTLSILSNRLKRCGIEKRMLEEEKTTIFGDEGQFQQICLNIISNAIDAMDDGGELTIRIHNTGNYTEVSFSDTGKGIKEEDQCKVFDYLFSTKGCNASGIGLYTTKKIIEGLNGKVILESEEGQGTKFTIQLPNEKSAGQKASQASL